MISASTYLAAKQALVVLAPLTVVLWRFYLSSIAFLLLLAWTPGPVLPPRRALRTGFTLGLLVGPLNQGLFLVGLSKSVAAHASLLYALTPLGVYVLSVLKGRERATGRATLGILTALCGVLFLLMGRGLLGMKGLFVGDLFILGAVMAWVLYTAEGKGLIVEFGFLRAYRLDHGRRGRPDAALGASVYAACAGGGGASDGAVCCFWRCSPASSPICSVTTRWPGPKRPRLPSSRIFSRCSPRWPPG